MTRPAHELAAEEFTGAERIPETMPKRGMLGLAEIAGRTAYHDAVAAMRMGREPLEVDAAFTSWAESALTEIHEPWMEDASEAFANAYQDEALDYEEAHIALWRKAGALFSSID